MTGMGSVRRKETLMNVGNKRSPKPHLLCRHHRVSLKSRSPRSSRKTLRQPQIIREYQPLLPETKSTTPTRGSPSCPSRQTVQNWERFLNGSGAQLVARKGPAQVGAMPDSMRCVLCFRWDRTRWRSRSEGFSGCFVAGGKSQVDGGGEARSGLWSMQGKSPHTWMFIIAQA
jgi:hypothetical protein